MANNKTKSRTVPAKQTAAGGTATQKAEPASHFRRGLIPLDEYAAREGISSDIVEQQGQLGVIQIRKFKGQRFVVDVPADQLSEFETSETEETPVVLPSPRPKTASKFVTVGLTIGLIVIIVSVFWLYMDARTRLDDLNAEHTALQDRYNELITANKNMRAIQAELAGSKAELARIQNRIVLSRTELEAIQIGLNKANRNLDAIQSELTGIQGHISLSKVEMENVQTGLNESRDELDTLHRQNTEPGNK
ncbi:MAG: hypothetical protein ABSG82_04500 [Sedimentisphaerales bacterium]|jgi:archaellum component FlaC